VAFGLEDLVALDSTELADGPIHRADPPGIGQRACTGLQWPGEKIIERGIALDAGIGGLFHVHAVTGHKPADHGMGECTAPGTCQSASEHSQRPLGQQVLRQHRESVGHFGLSGTGQKFYPPARQ
jgi:hypothetical protein